MLYNILMSDSPCNCFTVQTVLHVYWRSSVERQSIINAHGVYAVIDKHFDQCCNTGSNIEITCEEQSGEMISFSRENITIQTEVTLQQNKGAF
jgi:hypothetical protein